MQFLAKRWSPLETVLTCISSWTRFDVRCQKLATRPTLQRFEIINIDLVMMQLARPHIIHTKPIYVGFCILELSKVTMYEFHYDQIVKKYGRDAQLLSLLYTDTDSFMYRRGPLEITYLESPTPLCLFTI